MTEAPLALQAAMLQAATTHITQCIEARGELLSVGEHQYLVPTVGNRSSATR